MGREKLSDQVNALRWFHSIDFGDGIVSRGAKSQQTLADEADRFFGSIDLAGKSFLDIGAWNGFFSFEAKRRGAARVLATDKFAWTTELNGKAGFELARQHLGIDIEAREIDLPEITPDSVGRFDAVLFAGVYYHLFDAQVMLKHIAEVASRLLIVETHQDLLNEARPAMVYYPGTTLANDPSNFWGPNPALIRQLLTEAGFSEIYYRQNSGGHGRGLYLAFRDQSAAREFGFDAVHGWSDLPFSSDWVRPAKRTLGNLVNFLLKRPLS